MGTQLPPQKKGVSPQFSAHVYCDQMSGWINVPLGTKVGLGPGDIVLDGDPAPSEKGAQSPQFSAHIYCDQMAGCIRLPLVTEVGLSPRDIVIGGDPAPLP